MEVHFLKGCVVQIVIINISEQELSMCITEHFSVIKLIFHNLTQVDN